MSKIYFRWFSNFYSSSFLRLLATASKLPKIPSPNPAKPVFVSDSPVFANRFVDLLSVGFSLLSNDFCDCDSPFSDILSFAGVITTGTSTVGFPGSVILATPGTFPSGKSLFGTVPFPSSPIITVIVFPFLPGISTLVPGGYVDPSGFLGVTVTSPVFGSWSNSTVGVLRAGVVTSTGLDGLLFGSVTIPLPSTSPFGSLSFGTVPEPLSPIIT